MATERLYNPKFLIQRGCAMEKFCYNIARNRGGGGGRGGKKKGNEGGERKERKKEKKRKGKNET